MITGTSELERISRSRSSPSSCPRRKSSRIRLGSPKSTIQGTTISDNTSQQDGGGVFVDDGLPEPIMSIATSSLVGNRAARNAGGLFNEGRLTLGAAVVTGNNVPADPQP